MNRVYYVKYYGKFNKSGKRKETLILLEKKVLIK